VASTFITLPTLSASITGDVDVVVLNEVEIKNDAGNPVPVSGTVAISGSVAVTGPLTDAQLRATPVPVSGPLTDTELRAAPVDVLGPLTDAELRAAPVDVLGPLTDAELRATAVPVSAATLPLPTGAATETTLSALNAKVVTVDTSNVTVVASALPTGASTAANQTTTNASLSSIDTQLNSQATAANQATANASLSSIDSKLTAPLSVTGPLTDTELRATPVAVSGPLTDAELRAIAVPVSGPLTDVELRATPVDVLGPLTDAELRAVPVDVLGPLTDVELRATAVPVSVASLPLPTGAATESTLASRASEATLSALNAKVVTVDTGNVSVTASALPTGASTSALQSAGNASLSSIDTKLSSQATAANQATEIASLSSIDTKLSTTNASLAAIDADLDVALSTRASEATLATRASEATLAAAAASLSVLDDWDESDRAKVNPIVGQAGVQGASGVVSANTQRVTLATDVALPTGTNSIGQVTANAGTNLNTSALALEATQVTQNTRIGDLTEAAPGTDTASSGLNGRLQRIAQRITSLIALVPTSLGQKAMADSFAVVLASDQTAIPARAERGTLTDRSGSIGTTSVQIAVANSARKYFFIQCHSGTIWLNFGTTAVASQPSISLSAGSTFVMEASFVSTEAIHLISSGGTRDYTAKEG
jgi:hypothetical protein